MLNITLTELPEWVLIDTWWNVNVLNLTDVTNADSFNRYMVECELNSGTDTTTKSYTF